MEYHQEQDGSIRVENYRDGLHQDVTIGHLRQVGEDEDYWHFYPSEQCVLNAGCCKRLSLKLAELNGGLSHEPYAELRGDGPASPARRPA